MGGFLDLGPALHTEGCILSLTQSSHQRQSPPRPCIIPHQLQGVPGKDPAEIAAWRGRREIDGDNGIRVPGRRAAKKNGPGSPHVRDAWPALRKAPAAIPVTLPPAAARTKNSKAGWAKPFFLYYSNLTTCKPHDSPVVPALLLQQLAAKSNPGS